MNGSATKDPDRRAAIQRRINQSLRLTPEDRARSRFSSFAPEQSPDYWVQLMKAGSRGGFDGLDAALDEFDALRREADPSALHDALLSYLIHHANLGALGLSLPSLRESQPEETAPSKR